MRRPGVAFAAIVAFIAVFLTVDIWSTRGSQLLLGAVTWAALGVALRFARPEVRVQALLVVCVATCVEVLASIVWGVYTYRLENLPMFVPPGHGLVYLGGLSLSLWLASHQRALIWVALAAVNVWAVLGLAGIPRLDVGGAIGAVLLSYFLLRGRVPAIYAGVFLVVAGLELYGTAIGTWEWAETIPGTGIPDGNPPSVIASGYVWFDLVALAFAPRILELTRRLAGRDPARTPATTPQP